MLEIFPTWFWIFFTSMIPWWESRYAIPMAMIYFNWPWYHAMPIAIIGNILPIPFVLLFFRHAEKFLRNYKFWTKLMDWLFAKTRKRADAKIKRYEHIALLLFVAVPLPFTGAWTGSLIAYLFDLKFTKSIITIFIGIIIAALIMIALTLTVGNIFGIKI
jgi:uncharacterized membrane protein